MNHGAARKAAGNEPPSGVAPPVGHGVASASVGDSRLARIAG
jgi:hypothetical protein